MALEVNYDETVSDSDFFTHYKAKKEELESLINEWEEVQSGLDESQ